MRMHFLSSSALLLILTLECISGIDSFFLYFWLFSKHSSALFFTSVNTLFFRFLPIFQIFLLTFILNLLQYLSFRHLSVLIFIFISLQISDILSLMLSTNTQIKRKQLLFGTSRGPTPTKPQFKFPILLSYLPRVSFPPLAHEQYLNPFPTLPARQMAVNSTSTDHYICCDYFVSIVERRCWSKLAL